MISLRADNRTAVANTRATYLNKNYPSGSATLNLSVSDLLTAGDLILIGEMGKEQSEIFRVSTVNGVTGDITIATAPGVVTTTKFPHPESTKVSVLDYNEVRYYYTFATGTLADENPVFNTLTPLNSYTAINPSELFSNYSDIVNTSGFGWAIFRNSITLDTSDPTNPIPYTGFDLNTAATIFSDFDSGLNNAELKLVSLADKYSWLNEGLTLIKNKLNLTNTEYTVSPYITLYLSPGAAEYQLQNDFSDMVSIMTPDKVPVPFLPVSKADAYNGNTMMYYLRGRYIGFVPTPGPGMNIQVPQSVLYRYRQAVTRVTSTSTYIDLPNSMYMAIKDYMLYRAHRKFQNQGVAGSYMQDFQNNVNLYIQSSVKREANLDSWSPAPWANV
jgi:hypothetical protein